MSLLRCNELEAAMEALVVVPIHKCGNPLAGLLFVSECPAGAIENVFNGAESIPSRGCRLIQAIERKV